MAGHRQPLEVHLLANAMNIALGNVGNTNSIVAPARAGLDARWH